MSFYALIVTDNDVTGFWFSDKIWGLLLFDQLDSFTVAAAICHLPFRPKRRLPVVSRTIYHFLSSHFGYRSCSLRNMVSMPLSACFACGLHSPTGHIIPWRREAASTKPHPLRFCMVQCSQSNAR